MKNKLKLITAALGILLFSSCEEAENTPFSEDRVLKMEGSNVNLSVRTVVLDGNEYYAAYTYHGWTLCPKLPPKEEKK